MLPVDTEYVIHARDCIAGLADLPMNSVDFSIFSPPFPALYSYTSMPEDIGNSENVQTEAKLHLSFFYKQLLRVIKPGRVVIVHVADIPNLKRLGGTQRMIDFKHLNQKLAERAGFIWDYTWSVRKNPQSQAIRTRSRELQFAGLEADRTRSRGALPDYLIKLVAPGENAVPVVGGNQVSREDWIKWAENCWSDIRETDTLNLAEGRSESDTRHICPLQLSVINRMVRLYTNPGDLVLSPFTGIGSECHESLLLGRRFVGFEIKPEYHATALKNAERAIRKRKDATRTLWDMNPALEGVAGGGGIAACSSMEELQGILSVEDTDPAELTGAME